ncbi:PP2C family protein-serine/threonine phosphatase [Methylomagnum sp.]
MLNYCGGLGVGMLRHRDVSGVLTAWVRGADRVVAQRLAKIDGRPGAATFVGLWMRGSRGWLVHVGDARAYRLRISGRRARCEALTTDQTYAALGEAAPEGGSPDDPARMVGCGAVGHPPVTPLGLRPGDIALLCTDGFHRHVPPELIEERMDAWLGAGLPLKDMAAALTRCAYATGSQDDITVLLVRRNRRFRHRGTAFALLAVIGYFALGGWIGQAILWFKENG